MVAVPALTPLTTPPATLAVPAALLVHVPPLTELVKVVVPPTHTGEEDGESAEGVMLTVIFFVAAQPDVLV